MNQLAIANDEALDQLWIDAQNEAAELVVRGCRQFDELVDTVYDQKIAQLRKEEPCHA